MKDTRVQSKAENRGISEATRVVSGPLLPILQGFYLFCFNPDEFADPSHNMTP